SAGARQPATARCPCAAPAPGRPQGSAPCARSVRPVLPAPPATGRPDAGRLAGGHQMSWPAGGRGSAAPYPLLLAAGRSRPLFSAALPARTFGLGGLGGVTGKWTWGWSLPVLPDSAQTDDRETQTAYLSSPSARARATACVRLAAPSLPRMWPTCFLTVSSTTTSSSAICWFDLPAA